MFEKEINQFIRIINKEKEQWVSLFSIWEKHMDSDKTNLGKVLLAGILVFNTLDIFLTLIFIHLFGMAGEVSPLIAKILEISPVLFVVYKLFWGTLLYFAVRNHLEGKRVLMGLALGFVVYLYVIHTFIWGALSLPFQMLLGNL